MARKKLGDILIAARVIDASSLRAALAEQSRWGGPLGRILVDMRMCSEVDLVRALSEQLNIPAIDLETIHPEAEVLDLIEPEFAIQALVIPFARSGKFLDVAMADPTNISAVDDLRIKTQLNVRTHLAGPKAVERALARLYHRGPGMLDLSVQHGGGQLGAPSPGPEFSTTQLELAPSGRTADPARSAEPPSAWRQDLLALQQRVVQLEQMVSRDEDVLRKLLALLIDKGVATREEIMERMR